MDSARQPGNGEALLKPDDFGTFDGLVRAQWLADGRCMVLLEPFTFHELPGNRTWSAPRGALIDGASIPGLFWGPTIGGPFEGKFRDASVLHDYECCVKQRPWPDVHRLFYRAARARGEAAWRAKLMYFAIYMFGPKWEVPGAPEIADRERRLPPPESYSESDLRAIAAHIRRNQEMSLEDIEALHPQRAHALAAQYAGALAHEPIFVDLSARRRAVRSGPCVQDPGN